MLDKEPLGPVEARQLLRRILRNPDGQVVFTRHAIEDSMADRGIAEDEVYNCLSRGFCGSNITFEQRTWRSPSRPQASRWWWPSTAKP